MQSGKYSEISEKIDDAILVASNDIGRNVREIKSKHTIKEYCYPLFIAILPVIFSFLIVLILKDYFYFSETSMITIVFSISCLIAISSLVTITIKQRTLDKKLIGILNARVDVSEDLIDPIYEEIELLLNIERKYNLNIKEILSKFYEGFPL